MVLLRLNICVFSLFSIHAFEPSVTRLSLSLSSLCDVFLFSSIRWLSCRKFKFSSRLSGRTQLTAVLGKAENFRLSVAEFTQMADAVLTFDQIYLRFVWALTHRQIKS